MSKIIVLLSMLCVLLTATSCNQIKTVMPVINDIAAVVDDAQNVLSAIDTVVRTFFSTNAVSPEIQEKYAKVMTKTQLALSGALKALQGAEQLSQEDYDRAFENFKHAYSELSAFLLSIGIKQAPGMMKSSPGSSPVAIDDPIALTYRVQ